MVVMHGCMNGFNNEYREITRVMGVRHNRIRREITFIRKMFFKKDNVARDEDTVGGNIKAKKGIMFNEKPNINTWSRVRLKLMGIVGMEPMVI